MAPKARWGVAYASGNGVPEDPVQAFVWLKFAGHDELKITDDMQREYKAQLRRRHALYQEIGAKLTTEQKAEAAAIFKERQKTTSAGNAADAFRGVPWVP